MMMATCETAVSNSCCFFAGIELSKLNLRLQIWAESVRSLSPELVEFSTFLSSGLFTVLFLRAVGFSMLNLRGRGRLCSVIFFDLSKVGAFSFIFCEDIAFSVSLIANAFLRLSTCKIIATIVIIHIR